MSGSECGAPLVVVLLVTLTLLPRLSLAMGVALLSGSEEGLPGLSQAILQLTQRFATMEVNLESRLSRLTDSAAKGEAVFASLSTRLTKVDSLVEKLDALDSRLTQETSSLRSTITSTNRDLQDVSSRLGRVDRMAVAGVSMRLRGGEDGGAADTNRHDTRSSSDSSSSSDVQALSALITRNVAEEVERTLPAILDRSLATLHDSLYKRLSKSVGQLQEEVREAREELETLGTRTLTTATGARQDIRQGGKTTQDAVTDIKNKIQSVHRDLAMKITSSPSLSSLEPVLRQVNHSVVESIARAAAGLNVTLLHDAARWRGVSEGEDEGDSSLPALHCPDRTTVTALLEVKHLLQSLLRKSEDLRRGLTKKTSEGVDLLKLLHQRFAVLVRRMNTDPDYGQVLVTEMQDLGSLVESSYMAVMMAQTAFIDSCKRIQEEEPLLERKMTELLDKLVTNIDLGYQHNRQQLSELKEVVTRLGQRGAATNVTQEPARSEAKPKGQTLGDAAMVPGQVQHIILEAVEAANHTVVRLEEVEEYVDTVAADLLNTEWMDRQQKDSADQLVTAAKDLKGYAQEQILQSLDVYEILLTVIKHFNVNASMTVRQDQPASPTVPPPLELLNDAAPLTLTLPATCTAALLQQITNMKTTQTSALPSTHDTPLADADLGHQKQEERLDDVDEMEEVDEEEEEEEEEDVPSWYTDPVFLSGNYGTPDRGLPVFREEEWVDMDDAYDTEPVSTTSPPPPTTSITASPRPAATGGVDRYFGVS